MKILGEKTMLSMKFIFNFVYSALCREVETHAFTWPWKQALQGRFVYYLIGNHTFCKNPLWCGVSLHDRTSSTRCMMCLMVNFTIVHKLLHFMDGEGTQLHILSSLYQTSKPLKKREDNHLFSTHMLSAFVRKWSVLLTAVWISWEVPFVWEVWYKGTYLLRDFPVNSS